jgi:fluoride ion exporter CrcB/FEX
MDACAQRLAAGFIIALASFKASQLIAGSMHAWSELETDGHEPQKSSALVPYTVSMALCLAILIASMRCTSLGAECLHVMAAVLAAPLGAIMRWRLASLNKLQIGASFMRLGGMGSTQTECETSCAAGGHAVPAGTLSANVLACTCAFTALNPRVATVVPAALHVSFVVGILGSLSTVSTWVAEVCLLSQPEEYLCVMVGPSERFACVCSSIRLHQRGECSQQQHMPPYQCWDVWHLHHLLRCESS